MHFRQATTELSELHSDLKRWYGQPATIWLKTIDGDVESANISKTPGIRQATVFFGTGLSTQH